MLFTVGVYYGTVLARVGSGATGAPAIKKGAKPTHKGTKPSNTVQATKKQPERTPLARKDSLSSNGPRGTPGHRQAHREFPYFKAWADFKSSGGVESAAPPGSPGAGDSRAGNVPLLSRDGLDMSRLPGSGPCLRPPASLWFLIVFIEKQWFSVVFLPV